MMKASTLVRTTPLLALGLLAPCRAAGQTTEAPRGRDTHLDVQTFWPAGGPTDAFSLRSSTISPSGAVGFALVANFMRLPLRLCERTDGMSMGACSASANPRFRNVVDYALTTDFLFSLGILDRIQLVVAIPVVVAQSGEGATAITGGPMAQQLPDTSLRDLRFDASVSILRRARSVAATGLGLRVDLGAAIPFGDERGFQSSGGWTLAPMLVADFRTRYLTYTINVGARIREKVAEFSDVVWGSQLHVAAGATFRPSPTSPLSVGVESVDNFALVSREGRTSFTTWELLTGVRYAVDDARDIELFAGAGIPLNGRPTVPAWRGIVGLNYAPRGNDSDGDGVLDAEDRCPTQAEDRDGYEDTDGCPEADNDGDHVEDARDRCPNEPEDADNFQDDDGCPDPDNDGDGVDDADDECATEAAGDHPDEAHRGCPVRDGDGDGVLDTADQCATVAAGPRPDPARPGCPLPDRDHDGIADDADGCPDEAAGEHPDRYRGGCADHDLDRDGVLGAADRCPDQPETINGVTDDDGCPDPGAESVTWEASGESLHFTRPTVLTARTTVLAPAAVALFTQAAQRIRGRGGEVSRVHVEVEALPGPRGAEETHRLAGLVADVLIAHGVLQRQITAGPAPTPTPAPPSAPRSATPRRIAGTVYVRITRVQTPPATP